MDACNRSGTESVAFSDNQLQSNALKKSSALVIVPLREA